MDTYEKILNNGAGSFVDLVESFDEWDIEEMNMGYNREDFKSDLLNILDVALQIGKPKHCLKSIVPCDF